MTRGRHRRIMLKREAKIDAYLALALKPLHVKAMTLCFKADTAFPDMVEVCAYAYDLKAEIYKLMKSKGALCP